MPNKASSTTRRTKQDLDEQWFIDDYGVVDAGARPVPRAIVSRSVSEALVYASGRYGLRRWPCTEFVLSETIVPWKGTVPFLLTQKSGQSPAIRTRNCESQHWGWKQRWPAKRRASRQPERLRHAPIGTRSGARFGTFGKVRAYFVDQGPWLFCSIVFHALLGCSIPLIVLAVGQRALESAKAERPPPVFEQAKVDASADADLKPFDIGRAPLEPGELTTETLTLERPAEFAHEAEHNDDRDEFEHRGGGTPAKNAQPNAVGLGGFDSQGIGPGPVARGRGGVGLGLGTGTQAGSGGDGWGFGGRGAGHREAMLASGGGTRQTERAVAGALNWLARHQSAHGGWALRNFQSRCHGATCTGPAIANDHPAAATALGLLPFLAAGQTHRSKGPFKRNVEAGVRFLMANQNPKTGDLRMGMTMYDHGLAAIALCECYGMTGDRALRGPAQAALDFIAAAQAPDGGWRYSPGEPGDTSVTGWQIMALKSGQMAGL